MANTLIEQLEKLTGKKVILKEEDSLGDMLRTYVDIIKNLQPTSFGNLQEVNFNKAIIFYDRIKSIKSGKREVRDEEINRFAKSIQQGDLDKLYENAMVFSTHMKGIPTFCSSISHGDNYVKTSNIKIKEDVHNGIKAYLFTITLPTTPLKTDKQWEEKFWVFSKDYDLGEKSLVLDLGESEGNNEYYIYFWLNAEHIAKIKEFFSNYKWSSVS